jgi:hypothetical protein
MNILFWFNGSGGQRTERKIMSYPGLTLENLDNNIALIEDDLDGWKDSLRSNSEYKRWGWTEKFNPDTKEPIT